MNDISDAIYFQDHRTAFFAAKESVNIFYSRQQEDISRAQKDLIWLKFY